MSTRIFRALLVLIFCAHSAHSAAEIQWKFEAGGRILAGTRGTYFYALDADDGTELWSSKVGSSWIGSPAVILDETVYYGLSDGFAIMGFRHEGGAQTHFFQTASPVFAQPQPFGKQLIFGTSAGRLFSIDTATGQGQQLMHLGPEENLYPEVFKPENVPDDLTRYQATQWSIDRLLTNAQSVLNLTIFEGKAYVGTGSGMIYAVDLDGCTDRLPVSSGIAPGGCRSSILLRGRRGGALV